MQFQRCRASRLRLRLDCGRFGELVLRGIDALGRLSRLGRRVCGRLERRTRQRFCVDHARVYGGMVVGRGVVHACRLARASRVGHGRAAVGEGVGGAVQHVDVEMRDDVGESEYSQALVASRTDPRLRVGRLCLCPGRWRRVGRPG